MSPMSASPYREPAPPPKSEPRPAKAEWSSAEDKLLWFVLVALFFCVYWWLGHSAPLWLRYLAGVR